MVGMRGISVKMVGMRGIPVNALHTRNFFQCLTVNSTILFFDHWVGRRTILLVFEPWKFVPMMKDSSMREAFQCE